MTGEVRSHVFEGAIRERTFTERLKVFVHENPTTAKVILVAGLVLGTALLILIPFAQSLLGTALVVTLSLTGAALAAAATLALIAIDIFAPPHHDMSNHVFTPGRCDGGALYYEGDVPVLTLEGGDPFRAGKAQGYLCGDGISRITKRFNLVLHTLAGRPRADQLPETMKKLKEQIPERYLREIEGIVEGYNDWAKEQNWWAFAASLTVDDLLLMHLMPDSIHFKPSRFEDSVVTETEQDVKVGCTAIVETDPEKGVVFARNMDWPSFGISGAYSLVINRKGSDGHYSSVEVGVPGFAGTLTGMNSEGFSLGMNVCSGETTEIRGMPAPFYNRACLESCRSVEEAERFFDSRAPLGDYHLTIADAEKAISVHFYQAEGDKHSIRRGREGEPLITLNYRYNPDPHSDMHRSGKRSEIIGEFLRHREDRPLEDALALRYVNNWLTTHRVVMEPGSKTFRVAFDNAFAGKAPLSKLPTETLLQM